MLTEAEALVRRIIPPIEGRSTDFTVIRTEREERKAR
jgi:hypothetical protein